MKRRSLLGGLLAALTLGRLPRQKTVLSTATGTIIPKWRVEFADETWNFPEIQWEDRGVPGLRTARLGGRTACLLPATDDGCFYYSVGRTEYGETDPGGMITISFNPIDSGYAPTRDEARIAAERALRS